MHYCLILAILELAKLSDGFLENLFLTLFLLITELLELQCDCALRSIVDNSSVVGLENAVLSLDCLPLSVELIHFEVEDDGLVDDLFACLLGIIKVVDDAVLAKLNTLSESPLSTHLVTLLQTGFGLRQEDPNEEVLPTSIDDHMLDFPQPNRKLRGVSRFCGDLQQQYSNSQFGTPVKFALQLVQGSDAFPSHSRGLHFGFDDQSPHYFLVDIGELGEGKQICCGIDSRGDISAHIGGFHQGKQPTESLLTWDTSMLLEKCMAHRFGNKVAGIIDVFCGQIETHLILRQSQKMSRPKINQIIYMLRDIQETLANKLLWSVETLKPIAHSWVPARFGNLSYFDQFLLLNLALLAVIILQPFLDLFRPARIWKRMTRMFFSLPFVKRQFEKEVSKMKKEIASTFQGDQIPSLEEIPFKNMEIKISDTCEVESLKGQMSGSRYPGKAHSEIVSKIAKHDLFVNPIHPHVHPLIRQLEREVVQMATKMLNFRTESNQACGTIFSGGTESIIMATLAYREYKVRHEGVTRPNIVVCSTGHVAALKAASYLNLEFREINYDSEARMSIPAMKKAIDSQTVMVYLSYPNYPFGTADPVEEVAKICRSKGIPIHLDMCLGGFVVPFLTNKDGKPQLVVPKGVTTISLDPHKYGLSAKGCSLLLFSDQKYKRAQHMPELVNSGLSESPGFSGSRSGLSVASAWISMMKMGVRGYTVNAQALRNSAEKINCSLKQMGFRQFGSSTICVFNLIHDRIPASTIQNLMKKRGWGLAANREPVFLRYSLTPLNCSHVDQIISDFKECLKEAEGLPIQKPSADLELYGACSKIPDGETKLALIEYLLDAFMDIV